ncbi:Ras-related protein Rab-4A [Lemmus lemmus]
MTAGRTYRVQAPLQSPAPPSFLVPPPPPLHPPSPPPPPSRSSSPVLSLSRSPDRLLLYPETPRPPPPTSRPPPPTPRRSFAGRRCAGAEPCPSGPQPVAGSQWACTRPSTLGSPSLCGDWRTDRTTQKCGGSMAQTAMSETYDFLFKFLVIGNAGTGKSCLLHQFIEKKFKDDSNHTIGVEFGSKIINVGGKYVKLQIWDTAGQERFRSVTRSYYRGAAGALLVYDITSRETYNALTNWLTDARMLASQNIVIILCGNKKDLDADREVTFLEASRFAQENELMFLETSALTGENVEEAFMQCARKILNKIESGELDPERMGSGIQYGDAALRQLRSPRRTQAPNAQECGC